MQLTTLAIFASSVIGTTYAAKSFDGGASQRAEQFDLRRRDDDLKGNSFCAWNKNVIGPTFGKVISVISDLQDSDDTVTPSPNKCAEAMCEGKTVVEICDNSGKTGQTKKSDIGNWADQGWKTCYSPNAAKDSTGGPDGQAIYAFQQQFGTFDIHIRGNGDC